ncbi:hypothetical protein KZZ52_33720 [Dactylosporangium sp. AC04546]|uniref:conjugal transfer protein TrbL family protein n=1 Tax=Dactylosporangium sp. AC04546 TaxID=2862460 RepID=UPI001EE0AC36|nr:conjugal transfer protein TrbL family protein [Dactylosporangium sp. AC04546]WVK78934.1 hypothetical protein KZZ52_33720 [Dactylosporangium sp. AC04546]
MGAFLYGGLFEWLAERVVGMLDGLLALLTAAFFTSPDVTGLPQVQTLAQRTLTVVDAAFVLAIVAAGVIGMTHGTVQIRYEVKDLLPRLVFGFVAANFGTAVCAGLIEAANALTQALVGEPNLGPEVISFVKLRLLSAMTDSSAAVLAAVISLIIVVLVYVVLTTWLSRVVVLIVLAGIAPLALACYALPHTQPAVQLWWRSLLGCLATPTLQALLFSTGVQLLIDPQANASFFLGIGPAPATDVFNLCLAALLLWVTARVPKLVSRYVTRSGQSSSAAIVLRTLVVQSVTRRLRVPHR